MSLSLWQYENKPVVISCLVAIILSRDAFSPDAASMEIQKSRGAKYSEVIKSKDAELPDIIFTANKQNSDKSANVATIAVELRVICGNPLALIAGKVLNFN